MKTALFRLPYKRFAFLCCLIFQAIFFSLPLSVNAQERAHSGTDFWFVRSSYWDNVDATLYISSDYTTSGKIDLALFGHYFTSPFTVKAGETIAIPISSGQIYTLMVGIIEERALHITSERPIEVSVHCKTRLSDYAVTTLLPTTTLGYEYFSVNHEYIGPLKIEYGDFTILAIEDNTTVEITSKYSFDDRYPANKPYNIKLNKGEMYRVAAESSIQEVTGSRIRSVNNGKEGRKKIAVYSGSVRQDTQAKNFAVLDYYFQQLYPLRLWGQEFVTAPVLNKPLEAKYKIVAAHCNTKISINGASPIILNQGEHYLFSSSTACHFIADKPISIAQYFHHNWNAVEGAPETIMLNPVEQGVSEISMLSQPYTNIQEHYINITIPTIHTASFRLDGMPISFSPVPSHPTYSYAVKPVSAGSHTLKASHKFNAVAYGTTIDRSPWKAIEKYGYAVGANIPNDRHQKITFDYNQLCGGETINFKSHTEHPALSWLWHFGGGTTSTEQNPTHTYAEPGHYEVTLTTIGNDIYNCTSEMSTSVDLEVFSRSTSTVTASTVCQGTATSFQVTSVPADGPNKVVDWKWHFGDGATSSEQNPTHTYASADTYTAKLITHTASGCSNEVVAPNVVVLALPKVDFVAPTVCQLSSVTFTDKSVADAGSSIVSWQWDFGDGKTSSEQHPTHTYTAGGNVKVKLTVTTQSGCSQVLEKTISVLPIAQVQFQVADVCFGQRITFNNTTVSTGNTAYLWDFGDGASSDLANPSHTYQQAGTYTVTLTATTEAGCSTSSTETVTINPIPQGAFAPISVCETTQFSFQDKSSIESGTITGWKWNFGDGTTSSLQNPAHIYQKAGTYQVRLEVTSDKGCTGFVEQQVTVHPLLIATAGEDQLLPYGTPSTTLDANVPASGTGTWTIISDTGGNFSDVHDPKATFTGAVGQTYLLRWTVQGSGCSDAYDEVQLKLSVVLAEHLKIPNAFSPNGDGINDTWQLEGIEAFPGIQIRVINRWGDQVYHSRDYKAPWNGTRNGSPLPDGAYYYLIDAGLGAAQVLKGSVTILR